MQAKVLAKSWIVVPAKLRRRYGLMPGTVVVFQEADDKIIVVPRVSDPIEELYGKLAGKPSLTEALLADQTEELEREGAEVRRG